MSDQFYETIAKEEQGAMKATADENAEEIRKESEGLDDEVITPRFKPECSLAASTLNSNDNVKKESPEMNIQLQR